MDEPTPTWIGLLAGVGGGREWWRYSPALVVTRGGNGTWVMERDQP